MSKVLLTPMAVGYRRAVPHWDLLQSRRPAVCGLDRDGKRLHPTETQAYTSAPENQKPFAGKAGTKGAYAAANRPVISVKGSPGAQRMSGHRRRWRYFSPRSSQPSCLPQPSPILRRKQCSARLCATPTLLCSVLCGLNGGERRHGNGECFAYKGRAPPAFPRGLKHHHQRKDHSQYTAPTSEKPTCLPPKSRSTRTCTTSARVARRRASSTWMP